MLTSDAALGTMQAGVIGARRGNARGGDGIMDQARIMALRVTAGEKRTLFEGYCVSHSVMLLTIRLT